MIELFFPDVRTFFARQRRDCPIRVSATKRSEWRGGASLPGGLPRSFPSKDYGARIWVAALMRACSMPWLKTRKLTIAIEN